MKKLSLICLLLISLLAFGEAKPKNGGKSDDSDEDTDFFSDRFFDSDEDDDDDNRDLSSFSRSIRDSFEKIWASLRSLNGRASLLNTDYGRNKGGIGGIRLPSLPNFGFNTRSNLFGDLFGNNRNRMIFGIENGENDDSDKDDQVSEEIDFGTETDEEEDENGASEEGKVSSRSSSMTSFSSKGKRVEVRNSCEDGDCKLCIKNCARRRCDPKNCYKGRYEQIMTKADCPVAVCGKGCSGFATFTDGCPMCQCKDFSTREPCKANKDCPSDVCQKGLCVYPGISSGEETPTEEEGTRTEDEETTITPNSSENQAFTPPSKDYLESTEADEKNKQPKKKIIIRKEFN